MRRASLFPIPFVLLAAAVSAFAPRPAENEPRQPHPIAIRAGRLIDGTGAPPTANAVILIEGERITAVGPNVAIPTGAEVIDLSGATVLPGLIDCHTHLLLTYRGELGGDDTNMILTVARMSTAKRALLGARLGREDLEAGITTVRDVGNSGLNGDVALRDAINAGWLPGPASSPQRAPSPLREVSSQA
jgi:imidazolonepropionase-like amidohydrolase